MSLPSTGQYVLCVNDGVPAVRLLAQQVAQQVHDEQRTAHGVNTALRWSWRFLPSYAIGASVWQWLEPCDMSAPRPFDVYAPHDKLAGRYELHCKPVDGLGALTSAVSTVATTTTTTLAYTVTLEVRHRHRVHLLDAYTPLALYEPDATRWRHYVRVPTHSEWIEMYTRLVVRIDALRERLSQTSDKQEALAAIRETKLSQSGAFSLLDLTTTTTPPPQQGAAGNGQWVWRSNAERTLRQHGLPELTAVRQARGWEELLARCGSTLSSADIDALLSAELVSTHTTGSGQPWLRAESVVDAPVHDSASAAGLWLAERVRDSTNTVELLAVHEVHVLDALRTGALQAPIVAGGGGVDRVYTSQANTPLSIITVRVHHRTGTVLTRMPVHIDTSNVCLSESHTRRWYVMPVRPPQEEQTTTTAEDDDKATEQAGLARPSEERLRDLFQQAINALVRDFDTRGNGGSLAHPLIDEGVVLSLTNIDTLIPYMLNDVSLLQRGDRASFALLAFDEQDSAQPLRSLSDDKSASGKVPLAEARTTTHAAASPLYAVQVLAQESSARTRYHDYGPSELWAAEQRSPGAHLLVGKHTARSEMDAFMPVEPVLRTRDFACQGAVLPAFRWRQLVSATIVVLRVVGDNTVIITDTTAAAAATSASHATLALVPLPASLPPPPLLPHVMLQIRTAISNEINRREQMHMRQCGNGGGTDSPPTAEPSFVTLIERVYKSRLNALTFVRTVMRRRKLNDYTAAIEAIGAMGGRTLAMDYELHRIIGADDALFVCDSATGCVDLEGRAKFRVLPIAAAHLECVPMFDDNAADEFYDDSTDVASPLSTNFLQWLHAQCLPMRDIAVDSGDGVPVSAAHLHATLRSLNDTVLQHLVEEVQPLERMQLAQERGDRRLDEWLVRAHKGNTSVLGEPLYAVVERLTSTHNDAHAHVLQHIRRLLIHYESALYACDATAPLLAAASVRKATVMQQAPRMVDSVEQFLTHASFRQLLDHANAVLLKRLPPLGHDNDRAALQRFNQLPLALFPSHRTRSDMTRVLPLGSRPEGALLVCETYYQGRLASMVDIATLPAYYSVTAYPRLERAVPPVPLEDVTDVRLAYAMYAARQRDPRATLTTRQADFRWANSTLLPRTRAYMANDADTALLGLDGTVDHLHSIIGIEWLPDREPPRNTYERVRAYSAGFLPLPDEPSLRSRIVRHVNAANQACDPASERLRPFYALNARGRAVVRDIGDLVQFTAWMQRQQHVIARVWGTGTVAPSELELGAGAIREPDATMTLEYTQMQTLNVATLERLMQRLSTVSSNVYRAYRSAAGLTTQHELLHTTLGMEISEFVDTLARPLDRDMMLLHSFRWASALSPPMTEADARSVPFHAIVRMLSVLRARYQQRQDETTTIVSTERATQYRRIGEQIDELHMRCRTEMFAQHAELRQRYAELLYTLAGAGQTRGLAFDRSFATHVQELQVRVHQTLVEPAAGSAVHQLNVDAANVLSALNMQQAHIDAETSLATTFARVSAAPVRQRLQRLFDERVKRIVDEQLARLPVGSLVRTARESGARVALIDLFDLDALVNAVRVDTLQHASSASEVNTLALANVTPVFERDYWVRHQIAATLGDWRALVARHSTNTSSSSSVGPSLADMSVVARTPPGANRPQEPLPTPPTLDLESVLLHFMEELTSGNTAERRIYGNVVTLADVEVLFEKRLGERVDDEQAKWARRMFALFVLLATTTTTTAAAADNDDSAATATTAEIIDFVNTIAAFANDTTHTRYTTQVTVIKEKTATFASTVHTWPWIERVLYKRIHYKPGVSDPATQYLQRYRHLALAYYYAARVTRAYNQAHANTYELRAKHLRTQLYGSSNDDEQEDPRLIAFFEHNVTGEFMRAYRAQLDDNDKLWSNMFAANAMPPVVTLAQWTQLYVDTVQQAARAAMTDLFAREQPGNNDVFNYQDNAMYYRQEMLQLLDGLNQIRRTPSDCFTPEHNMLQRSFFRPDPREACLLSAACNTYFGAEVDPTRSLTALPRAIWRKRLEELSDSVPSNNNNSVDALPPLPPVSTGFDQVASATWTPAEKRALITQSITPPVLARAAIQWSLRRFAEHGPRAQAAVPSALLERILWSLVDSVQFWLFRRRWGLDPFSMPTDSPFHSLTTLAEARLHLQRTQHIVIMTEENARALLSLLLKQEPRALDALAQLAATKAYGSMPAENAHELFRLVLFGRENDPAVVFMVSDVDAAMGLGRTHALPLLPLDTRDAAELCGFVVGFDAELSAAIERIDNEAERALLQSDHVDRLALMHTCFVFLLGALMPFDASNTLFLQQRHPSGHLLYDHLHSGAVTHMARDVYGCRGMLERAVGGSRWLDEFNRLVYAGTLYDTELDTSVAHAVTDYFRDYIVAPVLNSAMRLLWRYERTDYPYAQATTDLIEGSAMCYMRVAHSVSDELTIENWPWIDCSPFQGLDLRPSLAFVEGRDGTYTAERNDFELDSRYSFFEWRNGRQYYLRPSIAQENRLPLNPTDSHMRVRDTGTPEQVFVDLYLPPPTRKHLRAEFFVTHAPPALLFYEHWSRAGYPHPPGAGSLACIGPAATQWPALTSGGDDDAAAMAIDREHARRSHQAKTQYDALLLRVHKARFDYTQTMRAHLTALEYTDAHPTLLDPADVYTPQYDQLTAVLTLQRPGNSADIRDTFIESRYAALEQRVAAYERGAMAYADYVRRAAESVVRYQLERMERVLDSVMDERRWRSDPFTPTLA